jgi:predicted CoA-substrate-specific enzyme activase
MIVAGCDVGSLTAKAVIMEEGKILASEIIRAGTRPALSAQEVMDKTMQKVGLSMEKIAWCVGTGYGRKQIPFAHGEESEIACHGRGAVWSAPSVRTIVDIGGQDAKAIKVDDRGNVIRYIYNDKCASGTGRFLEIMADALGIALDDLGELARSATNPVTLSNQCVVFAETEIISLVNEGRNVADIIAGLHRALANRAAAMVGSIVAEEEVAMTGGVAKNAGMFRALETALGVSIRRIEHPQLNGAVGAALLARDAATSRSHP